MKNKIALLKGEGKDRLIFVGGSGLFCGLDSPRVEDRLHRPVINLGLFARFGITPLLREIKPYLRPGDAVIVVPEYGIVFDEYDAISRPFLFALSPSRNFLPLYATAANPVYSFVSDCYALVRSKSRALPLAIRDAVRDRSMGPLTRGGHVDFGRLCNANGDSRKPWPTAASPELLRQRGEDYFSGPGYAEQSLEAFNAFCRAEALRGVSVFMLFSAYPAEEYRRQQDGMRKYVRRLREQLACPILGRPEDFLYPYSFFTDTVFHLSLEGKRIRTERVIALLKQVPALSAAADSYVQRSLFHETIP
jgi:hypothetical protein